MVLTHHSRLYKKTCYYQKLGTEEFKCKRKEEKEVRKWGGGWGGDQKPVYLRAHVLPLRGR